MDLVLQDTNRATFHLEPNNIFCFNFGPNQNQFLWTDSISPNLSLIKRKSWCIFIPSLVFNVSYFFMTKYSEYEDLSDVKDDLKRSLWSKDCVILARDVKFRDVITCQTWKQKTWHIVENEGTIQCGRRNEIRMLYEVVKKN